jgi:hypothetical protein
VATNCEPGWAQQHLMHAAFMVIDEDILSCSHLWCLQRQPLVIISVPASDEAKHGKTDSKIVQQFKFILKPVMGECESRKFRLALY